MRVLLGVVAVASLSIACSAQAKDAQVSADPQKPVCKRVYDADLGSHFTSSKRICRTAAEWKEIEDINSRALQTMRDNNGRSSPPPSLGGGPN